MAKHVIHLENFDVHLETIKTYHLTYTISGSAPSEILIAVGVPETTLYTFEDFSNIKSWIIVPWQMSEVESFLKVHEATNLETGDHKTFNEPIDSRLVNAIRWLMDTSFPNEGFHHPFDLDRLHVMSNALAHYQVSFDYNDVVYACMKEGMIPSSARLTAEAFIKARKRKLIVHDKSAYPLTFLNDIMNGK